MLGQALKSRRGLPELIGALLALSMAAPCTHAADERADTVAALRAELERLKVEQAERAAEMQRLEERLAVLETAAGQADAVPARPPAPVVASERADAPSRLTLSGDFRLRYEGNYGDADQSDWERGVLRARLGASYVVNDWLSVGARLATGDPDDPNSSDVTLSNFADDFDVSLDQAYAQFKFAGSELWGGKFPLPFVRTDLVWDGDVNPQGIGGSYRMPVGDGALELAGLYFLVDQSVAGSNSSMWGAQVALDMPVAAAFRFEVAGALYDYSLAGVAGADAGDFRSNLIEPDGRYLSDFDLADVIVSATYIGMHRWPLRLTGEYVRNRGARTSGDTGYSIELSAGQALARGDWRFGYGYSVAEVDAVLAAFSHDNTTIATNYQQHTLFVNYALTDGVLLDATLYRYRPYDAAFGGIDDPDDWLDRLR
ncbi:MAG: putative porin, partial [Steroidobacteraceae bacterium]